MPAVEVACNQRQVLYDDQLGPREQSARRTVRLALCRNHCAEHTVVVPHCPSACPVLALVMEGEEAVVQYLAALPHQLTCSTTSAATVLSMLLSLFLWSGCMELDQHSHVFITSRCSFGRQSIVSIVLGCPCGGLNAPDFCCCGW